MRLYDLGAKFAKGNCFFGAVELTENVGVYIYICIGYGIGFDASSSFSLNNSGGFSKNSIIFRVTNGSSAHADNKKKF